jgi:hypothetical protein
MVDPADYEDLEALRHHLIEVFEDRLAETQHVPWAAPGREFQFLRSQVVLFDTGLRAGTPDELAALIPKMSTGSIFFHFLEARRRPPLRIDDFSAWLSQWAERYDGVRRRLAAIDYFLWSLTELRERIGGCFEDARGKGGP